MVSLTTIGGAGSIAAFRQEHIMSTTVGALSCKNPRSALISRITARRELMEAMVGWASTKDLEELTDDEEEDLKALARLPVDSLDHVREKATLLADRELEERVTFGELALIMSIISDLSHQTPRPVPKATRSD
jgi:hypothetical protein